MPTASEFNPAKKFPPQAGTAFEDHFTPEELAALWKLDPSTIRRMFRDEEGVMKYGREGSKGGRREYLTLRIPASVAERVYKRRAS
jgi:hypothetical protein